MFTSYSNALESCFELLSREKKDNIDNPNMTHFLTFARPSIIQLWQFIKDLLNNPNQNYAKHKLDFHLLDLRKVIGDSVRVVKTWGSIQNPTCSKQ